MAEQTDGGFLHIRFCGGHLSTSGGADLRKGLVPPLYPLPESLRVDFLRDSRGVLRSTERLESYPLAGRVPLRVERRTTYDTRQTQRSLARTGRANTTRKYCSEYRQVRTSTDKYRRVQTMFSIVLKYQLNLAPMSPMPQNRYISSEKSQKLFKFGISNSNQFGLFFDRADSSRLITGRKSSV